MQLTALRAAADAERSAGRACMVAAGGINGPLGGKISEAFLDFASPLIEAADPHAGPAEIEPILKIAFTVWNAVVFDTVNGNTRFVDKIRQATASDLVPAAFVELLLSRKRLVFGNDERLIGRYELRQTDGEWVLRAEARNPRTCSR